ncbi:putative polysaccharide biosynthesis protein [Salinicoccus halodurans]|uniref:Membrane protein involved in the export of O-antigen and teichoic acid n=1 Tax=Salinicoccus halodurans TaxID=407035 RepID=A0A0F7HMG7_9STAP|nr:polysaccharide biosynthesis protein [Salinicoccus halodurans]AKG74317.1 polysaccharide biosynthesis protein [Salinicoccus halodurans]SFK94420.1 Membrane protein involved in the export of O-antigen and teichoic acid [Salinicoccus halodurans]
MSDSNKLVRGTFLLTIATVITKVLGMLYLIPFYSIMGGEENLALYGYAYTPYTIMLSIAAAGVPGAVSKYVAKYNALGAYATSQKLYRSSLIVMLSSGFIAFIALYFAAPFIAELQMLAAGGGEHRWSTEDITGIIRVVGVAVIIVPFMATWRGIFQGFESFGPTSVSSVIEQILRIAFLLGGSFVVIYMVGGSIQTANEIAVFAAFIGGLGSLATLWYFWRKRKHHIQKMVETDKTDYDFSYREMYSEIVRYGIPFIIVGISIPLTMFIDQLTHNNGLAMGGVPASYHDAWFGMLNLTTHKLVMIPTAFASAFAITILPFITKNFHKGKLDDVHHQIKLMILMLLFFAIPAALGMMILSAPLYTSFYSYNEMGIKILLFYAPVSVVISLFSVTCSIVQGIDKQNLTLYVVLIMLAIKAAINIPLIMQFQTVGAVMGTGIALSIGVLLNFYIIKKYGKFHFRSLFRPLAEIGLYSLVMLLVVEIFYYVFILNLDIEQKLNSVIVLAIAVPVGGLVYLIISFRTGLADEILGARADKIRKKLKVL